MTKKKIKYKTGGLIMIRQPDLYKHAGIRNRTLPEVHNVKEKARVKPRFGTTEELIKQIDA